MNGRGPINRKKNVVGKASDDSLKTHGEGLHQGPVGDPEGNQARKEAVTGGPRRASQQPYNRPKTTSGQASSGSMNTHGAGMGGARPQQNRPTGGQVPPIVQQQRPQQQSSGSRAGGKGFNPLILIILAVVLLGGGGGLSGLFGNLLGGGSNTGTGGYTGSTGSYSSSTEQSSGVGGLLESLLGGDSGNSYTGSTGSYSGSTGSYSGNTGSSYSGSTGSYGGSTGSYSGSTGSYSGGTGSYSGSTGSYSGSTGSSSGSFGGLGGLGSLGGLSGLGGSPTGSSAFSEYGSDLLQQLLGGSWYSGQTGLGSTAQDTTPIVAGSGASNGKLNRSVAPGSRAKYTKVLGNGRDTFTLMVYMCGADLESRSAMGTKDLQEMLYANYGSNVRVIVFTGGSRQWQNKYISNQVNQVWQVANGKLECLVQNAGNSSMTNPATLSGFIQYCAQNFTANRYGLILWDHGSGSVTGYGYDEKNARTGSMSLAGLNTAFQDGGVKFDFIGFDACLMATVENALMCSKYADYLIASEETEPGIGWYYTNWLTALGADTSLSTLDIGQKICDDFVSQCGKQCRGQQTTLSLVDLAEVENTVPGKLTSFAQSISKMITDKQYKTVSNARNGTREFAQSTRIDQVDLTDLCDNLNTTESKALAEVLKEAVKYNRTGNISHAYGLSVYFPYQRVSNVDKAVSTYAAIGMDDSYAKAISAFASVEASGQGLTGGGHTSAIPSLFGLPTGGSSAYGASDDMLNSLLNQFLGGGYSSISGLTGSNVNFLTGRSVSGEDMVQLLSGNLLDRSALVFEKAGDNWVLSLTPEQWSLVHGVDLNLFYDNGEGYVDLGLDNLFSFDEEGRLVADTSGTWLAINGQPVPYYHETSEYLSESDWRITGRVPALLNDVRVDLLVVFDNDHETGYVVGARNVYDPTETQAVAKNLSALSDGDRIVFLADLYDYEQNYTDSYALGSAVTVNGALSVTDVELPDASKCMATYRITDIYNQAYWTPVIDTRAEEAEQ